MNNFPLLQELVEFIAERYAIHLRRTAGESAPWTKDPILQRYKFCNVRREDDRVTKWIHSNWVRQHQADADLWLALYVARVFNRVSTLQAIGYPCPWGRCGTAVLQTASELKFTKAKVFGAAYMIHSMRTLGPYRPKINYYGGIFTKLWERRSKLRPVEDEPLQAFYNRLMNEHGFGSFMAAQVVADCKWTPPLRTSPDWNTFAASGPGSRRGLNRLLGNLPSPGWKGGESSWHTTLLELSDKVLPKLPKALRSLDAQNLQNCLCEFDKYQRVKLNQGRPKQKFKPSEEPYA